MKQLVKQLVKWLLSFFGKKAKEEYAVFRPSKRILYRYFDGEKDTAADPLALYKKFISSGKDLTPTLAEADVLAAQGQIYDKLISKLRDLFHLKTYEEGGLTDMEVLALFDDFLSFCGAKKKEGEEIKEALGKELEKAGTPHDLREDPVSNPNPDPNQKVGLETQPVPPNHGSHEIPEQTLEPKPETAVYFGADQVDLNAITIEGMEELKTTRPTLQDPKE